MTLADKTRLQVLLQEYQKDLLAEMFSGKYPKRLKKNRAQYNHSKMILRRLSIMISSDLKKLEKISKTEKDVTE